ncbi:MAG TPA: ATP-binding protein, partial [Flavobacteriales bacterium]
RRGGEAWTVRNALVVLSTPPWYQTFWARSTFVLLGAMLLIGLGVLFQRIKQGSELRRLSTLQRLSEERRRIAADVHDDLGADLSHLLGQARMVQAGNAGIEQLTEGIGRSMDKIDDIIWSLDPERDTVRSTADFIETWTRNYAHAHGLDFRSGIKVSAHEPTIRADQRRELALVMKEAMRNVVKHAKARSIHLSVIMETGRMKLVLQDDGEVSPIGRTSERRSGSANMARRVERLGGRSYFEPVAPRGTRFIVELDLEGRPKE